MAEIKDSAKIDDVQIAQLVTHPDRRGRFIETFRKEWFPQCDFEDVQMNVSCSSKGVIRGLHYHHRQIDYWYVASGRIRVGMCDLRPSSNTFMGTETVDLDAEEPRGLFIPIGVAHGFVTLSDIVLIYLVDNYYDGTDENAVAWNDPDIGLNWGVSAPIVSERDKLGEYLEE